MRQRNHKFIILCGLAIFGAVLGFVSIAGCSDNPDAKAAKELRNQTSEAVKLSVDKQKYDDAQKLIQGSLGNRSKGLTKDAAYLAAGNLAMAGGRQLQADLGLKTLPLRGNINELEHILRDTERSLIEKERISKLLELSENEVAELRQLLNGDTDKEGFDKQFEAVNSQMNQLLEQKASLQESHDEVQAVLDTMQTDADDLIRKAELAEGDQRLKLEKDAFSILQQRKEHYIQVQSIENKMKVLDDDIDLLQVSVNGLVKARQEIQRRIDEILNSPSRTELQSQLSEIDNIIATNLQRLTRISSEIPSGLNACRQDSDKVCDKYQEAISSYQKVKSSDAAFPSILRAADSAYLAALTRSNYIRVHRDISVRLKELFESSDEKLISAIQNKLPSVAPVDAEYKDTMTALFDQAAEAYETAFSRAGSIGQDAKCSIAKSHLLTLHSKLQAAELIEDYSLADSAEAAMNVLIENKTELGACFTQSEAMRVVKYEGLSYLPSLPINLDVFLDDKKRELSAWKLLPLTEQESAIDETLVLLDELVAKYGQPAETQLQPLKQEMLAAKERGFDESLLRSGNGEPNSLY